jgi:hypothetical protein
MFSSTTFLTKRSKTYNIIPVTSDFSLSLKRINYSWRDFYGIIKVPPSLIPTSKLPNRKESLSDVVILIRLLPLTKTNKPLIIRNLFKNPKVHIITSGNFFEFVDKPLASALDLVAANLRIAKGFIEILPKQSPEFSIIADKLVYNLRKQLRRHRITKLGLLNLNMNLDTPKTSRHQYQHKLDHTSFGRNIKAVLFTLNKGVKVSRSARKRQNKLNRKKFVEDSQRSQKNTLKKIYKTLEKRKLEKIKELKYNQNYEKAEALLYLKELKSIEKYYPFNPENHLNMLFSSVHLHKKILLLEKSFFDSTF